MEINAVASNPGGRAISRVAGRVARIPRHQLRLAAMVLGAGIILPQILGVLSSAAVSPGAKLLTASGVLMIGATWFEASSMDRHNLLADLMFGAWVFVLALVPSNGLLVLGLMVTFAMVRPLFGPSLYSLVAASVFAVGAYSVALRVTGGPAVTFESAAALTTIAATLYLARMLDAATRRVDEDIDSHTAESVLTDRLAEYSGAGDFPNLSDLPAGLAADPVAVTVEPTPQRRAA